MSSSVNDIIKKYKQPIQESKFQAVSQELSSPSLFSVSETDISGITEEGFNREAAFA